MRPPRPRPTTGRRTTRRGRTPPTRGRPGAREAPRGSSSASPYGTRRPRRESRARGSRGGGDPGSAHGRILPPGSIRRAGVASTPMPRRTAPRMVLVLATLVATAAPVFAAGLPACCVPSANAEAAKPTCCKSKGAPCCKTPEAPKPDAAAKHAAPSLAAAAPLAWSAPAAVVAAEVPTLASVAAARREHGAPTPDDSPPDRLARHHVLLI